MLLRGSSLRNTAFAIGFIVYTGHETKVMMNSSSAKFKMSKIERETNRQIILMVIVQFVFCLCCAVIGTITQVGMKTTHLYLCEQSPTSAFDKYWPLIILRSTGTWILIFT